MKRHRLIHRVSNLLRGVLLANVRGLEARHPAAAYDAAIQERTEQHDRLREAISRLTYLLRRVESTIESRRGDLEVVEKALAEAVQSPRDEPALELLQRQRLLREEIAPLEERRRALLEQCDEAKRNLVALARSVRDLRDERNEMVARRAHAETRLQMAEVVRESAAGSSVGDEVLENARASVQILEHMADLDPMPSAEEERAALAALHREAAFRADREALAALRARLSEGG